MYYTVQFCIGRYTASVTRGHPLHVTDLRADAVAHSHDTARDRSLSLSAMTSQAKLVPAAPMELAATDGAEPPASLAVDTALPVLGFPCASIAHARAPARGRGRAAAAAAAWPIR